MFLHVGILCYHPYLQIHTYSAFCLSQECVSDREQGQTKLNAVVFCGELLLRIASRDREETVRAKMRSAREDWKTLMTTLHQREAILQVGSASH